ncbi:arf GAP with GTPase, ANK repeat and PH [Trichuris trichiura]|uniref:Arf GAP with GTPase, ANK repeat and PH n=1 Tax=Trichuris trichiura TaxID=36087 RepID=A0A077Z8V0_TRITR|nr:arf GAP with GTPase, ANK repeat and PH [Trichuris trichiura]
MSRQFSYASASTVSEQIHQEIQRFESVHPCIYAVYDLIELISDALIAQQIRDNVVRIEDSFVNSQEWTCSRAVPELRLGLLGSLSSGKSSLVHRYLTGTYINEESPEGGRFKKEIVIDGQPYLLLIREEGGPPEQQFTHWVDAVIFVFSLKDETSFNAVYHYYAKMAHYRNTADIPLVLVGTQDAITEGSARAIDDSRARKLANDLKRCGYYETCAIYGHNVERVFRDACYKIINHRIQEQQAAVQPMGGGMNPQTGSSCPTTPSVHPGRMYTSSQAVSQSACSAHHKDCIAVKYSSVIVAVGTFVLLSRSVVGGSRSSAQLSRIQGSAGTFLCLQRRLVLLQDPNFRQTFVSPSVCSSRDRNLHMESTENISILTPASTPNAQRKNRRISNIFNRKDDERPKNNGEMVTPGIGEGRAIPVKQGLVYKRSSKALNKEWKKKYVCLYSDGRLAYYPSLKDYMENVHGKEVLLGSTTVKVPGKKPQHVSRLMMQSVTVNGDAPVSFESRDSGLGLNAFETAVHGKASTSADVDAFGGKRPLLFKGERDEWVQAIERQILSCLLSNETDKRHFKGRESRDLITTLRKAPGNSFCADCGCPNPDWASLNLGALICIQCSGIHRNLGSHISKVRSLDLDEWPLEHVWVLQALGNELVNSVWEFDIGSRENSRLRFTPPLFRETKEQWIRAKYENKEFLAAVPVGNVPLTELLMEAICKQDLPSVFLLLAHCDSRMVNATLSSRDRRTPLHLACAVGNPIIAQLLIWFNADPKALDQEGRSALWYAQNSNSSECVKIIRQNGCSFEVQSDEGSGGDSRSRQASYCQSSSDGDCSKACGSVFENLPASVI